ncbi:MAG TPA: lipopolysaccharide kinase InaA family protein [Candidatus Binataceae bacterium]|nr:lipopolysaccharide kinase InaA family protein [Candidatus Binataceae bacterium]
MRMHVLYAREPRWRQFAERAEDLIADPAFRAVKSEGRTLAGIIELPDGNPVFIKKSQSDSWLRGIVTPIIPSSAARAVAGAAMLEEAGIAHPRPLAAMELRSRGALRASYLISEAIVGGDTLSRFALGPGGVKGRDARRRRRILDTVARQVRRIHDARLYTRDLQETNVMVADDEDGGFLVWFLDLEDFRRVRRVDWAHRMRNLVHLDRSIGRFLCRAARLAFLYAYLGGRPQRAEARRLVAQILALRARIDRRHSPRQTAPAAAAFTKSSAPSRTEKAHG